jgi:signal transduction histidine kinase
MVNFASTSGSRQGTGGAGRRFEGDRFEKVRAAIAQIGPSDHVCTLYDQRDKEAAMAASYIRAGLDRGEMCVCVVDDGEDSILAALASEGVDVDEEVRRGRLTIFEKPLSQGMQTLDMLDKIEQFAGGARKAGYTGFRIVGEMTWALGGDLKDLAQFEARLNLNRVWERHACVGLCQFDVHRLSPDTLRQMIMVHPLVIVGDRVCRNPYYVPPELYLSADWPAHEADWMMKNLEQLQRAQDGLRASQESYRSLARRLVDLQEQERRGFARELHARVGQNLTAMRGNADLVRARLGEHDDAEIRVRNEDSLQLIESTFKAVRNLMHELRPPMLDEHGLAAPLKWHAKQFTERTGIRVEIDADEAWRCGVETEIALFRIAQEALTNAARHSRARQVSVGLHETDGRIVLTIEDDGVGFDRADGAAGRAGYGFAMMSERADALGGTLEVRSGKGQGTCITVSVPRRP